MKNLRKSNLFSTCLAMLVSFSVIGFVGCERENVAESQFSEYLDLKTYEMSKMSVEDMETIGQALQRLDISKQNGLYQIQQSSGAQVNISEDLFDHIAKGFEHTNKIYSHRSFNRLIPRLKSSDTEGETAAQDSTHCASYALAGMGGFDYDEVAAYSDSTYGTEGVPADSMDSFFYHYYPNGSSASPSDLSTGPMGTNMLYFQNSDTTGHAVNATFYDANSNIFIFDDPQTGESGYVSGDDVMGVYFP